MNDDSAVIRRVFFEVSGARFQATLERTAGRSNFNASRLCVEVRNEAGEVLVTGWDWNGRAVSGTGFTARQDLRDRSDLLEELRNAASDAIAKELRVMPA